MINLNKIMIINYKIMINNLSNSPVLVKYINYPCNIPATILLIMNKCMYQQY